MSFSRVFAIVGSSTPMELDGTAGPTTGADQSRYPHPHLYNKTEKTLLKVDWLWKFQWMKMKRKTHYIVGEWLNVIFVSRGDVVVLTCDNCNLNISYWRTTVTIYFFNSNLNLLISLTVNCNNKCSWASNVYLSLDQVTSQKNNEVEHLKQQRFSSSQNTSKQYKKKVWKSQHWFSAVRNTDFVFI